jgi:FkbM family methyltransferase
VSAALPRPIPGRGRLGALLARRVVPAGTPYRGMDGIVLDVDPSDVYQAAMLAGVYDPLIASVVRDFARPGSTAVDLGGHVGYVASLLARRVGPSGAVHVVEANPAMAARIRRHRDLNGFDHLHVHACAMTDGSTDHVALHVGDQPAWTSIHGGLAPDTHVVDVPARSWDDLADAEGVDPTTISLIKVDVEGAEDAVVAGMRRTLEAGSPAVIVEIDPARARAVGADPTAVPRAFAELGYEALVPRLRTVARRPAPLALAPWDGTTASEVLFRRPRGARRG